jgi:hypothetical protein
MAGTGGSQSLDIELPPSPLGAVCALESWGEVYQRLANLI